MNFYFEEGANLTTNLYPINMQDSQDIREQSYPRKDIVWVDSLSPENILILLSILSRRCISVSRTTWDLVFHFIPSQLYVSCCHSDLESNYRINKFKICESLYVRGEVNGRIQSCVRIFKSSYLKI